MGRTAWSCGLLGAAVVSQSHARIFFDRSVSAFVLEDLDSKNGTRLNGLPVEGVRRLGAVHVVTFGEEHDCIFVAEPPDVAPHRPVGDAVTRRHPTPAWPTDTRHCCRTATGISCVMRAPAKACFCT